MPRVSASAQKANREPAQTARCRPPSDGCSAPERQPNQVKLREHIEQKMASSMVCSTHPYWLSLSWWAHFGCTDQCRDLGSSSRPQQLCRVDLRRRTPPSCRATTGRTTATNRIGPSIADSSPPPPSADSPPSSSSPCRRSSTSLRWHSGTIGSTRDAGTCGADQRRT